MFDGFDDLENQLESQERDAESIVEQEQNAETREQQLEAAVSQLERDAAVSAKLQANREQTKEEVERVAETKRECSARLTDVRQSLSELQKEVNAEEAVIAELREMGEDVSESEGILQDRKEWLRACWEKAETVAEILGLDIGELNFESTEGGDGSYGGDSGAEKQDEELESDNEENNADHSMNKKEDRTHMSWGDKIKSFFGFDRLKNPLVKDYFKIINGKKPLVTPDINEMHDSRQTTHIEKDEYGREVEIFDHPYETAKKLPYSQGNNQRGMCEDCGLANLGMWLTIAGSKYRETDVVEFCRSFYKKTRVELCSYDGGTYPEERAIIWKQFGLEARIFPLDRGNNEHDLIERIGQAVEAGRAVSIGLNAGELWGSWGECYGDGGSNHVIGVISCERDVKTGEITYFYINDTGRGKKRDACRRVPVEDIIRASFVARGSAMISNLPVW